GPPNAIINGIFILTPTEEQGNTVFDITLIAVQDDDPSISTSETFRIFVAALPAVQHDQPSLDPLAAPPGGDITVSGDSYLPGSPVGIYLFSDPVLLGITTADIGGAFSLTVTIPPTTPAGTHNILVMGTDPDGALRTLVGTFEIEDDPDNDGLSTAEEVLTGTDPSNPDSDGDGVIDGIDASWLVQYLNDLPNNDFKRRLNRGAMKLTIVAAAISVNLGNGETALAITGSLHNRIDGCGATADGNDWIVDCESQIGFRSLLDLYERGVATLPLPKPFPWS
ncbi:MAG: hypothetical protein WBM90_09330, partial [Acidimicrobiia bacterium]